MQSYTSLYQDYSADNQFDYGRRSTESVPNRSRRSSARRSSKTSASVGGMHRRRNKRWTW